MRRFAVFAYNGATGQRMRPGTIVGGKVTVDVGHNLVGVGLSTAEMYYLPSAPLIAVGP